MSLFPQRPRVGCAGCRALSVAIGSHQKARASLAIKLDAAEARIAALESALRALVDLSDDFTRSDAVAIEAARKLLEGE